MSSPASVSNTQRVLALTEIGKPLILSTLPIPLPAPHQIQIRITAAGLNPVDQLTRDTGLFLPSAWGALPTVLGDDVVGTVTATGSAVSASRFQIGERVFGQAATTPGGTQNGLQEYCVLDEACCARVPDEVSDDEAATLPTALIAAVVGLCDRESGLGFPSPWVSMEGDEAEFDYGGQTLLVVGGGSSCGKFAVQVASLMGLGRIVVVAGKGNDKELRGYGATDMVDRHDGDVLARVKECVGDELVYAFDAVNGPEGQSLALDALSHRRKGKLARLVGGEIDVKRFEGKTAGFGVMDVFGSSHAKADLCMPFWERVPEYLEAGKIKPMAFQVVDGLDADKVNEVLDRYKYGLPVQKVNVHP
jgi:NADPH2:quinone reductase